MTDLKELKKRTATLKVLYVEDDSDLRQNTAELLEVFFAQVDTAENGKAGLQQYNSSTYDILITDIHMPVMNGIQLVEEIRKLKKDQIVIVISAHDESVYLIQLINLGVNYFIIKPVENGLFFDVINRATDGFELKKLRQDYQAKLEIMVREKTRELVGAHETILKLNRDIVMRLTSAAEYRDVDTGRHIERLGLYASLLARHMKMEKSFVESIHMAAPLHDIGKIGISDEILLKPGPLTPDEFEIMKQHTVIGGKILGNSDLENIKMMEIIALTHHERWDGTGYPYGLAGEMIPLAGRIVNICDQYDALRSDRPYKKGLSHQETLSILTVGDGRTLPEHFDPRVLAAFKEIADQFDRTFTGNLK